MSEFTAFDYIIVIAIIATIAFFGWKFWNKKQDESKAGPENKVAPTLSDTPAAAAIPAAQATQVSGIQTAPTQSRNLHDPVTLPDPWMPLNTYPSVQALLSAVQQNSFSQIIRVNGQQVWAGFGPGADYVTNPDGLVFGKPIPRIEPKPIEQPKPEPIEQPKLQTGYAPNARELQAGVQGGASFGEFGAKADGEFFRSHEMRAVWTDAVLGQGTTPNLPTTSPPLVPAVDAKILTDLDWAYYNNHPEVHSMVYGDPLYMAQNINRVFYAGSSDQTKFDLRGYNGVLR